jgi:alanine racemase
MSRSPHVTVQVDLARVRANALAIKQRVRADVLAVVKADAYGLGAAQVIAVIADVVDGFCFFNLHEVVDIYYAGLSSKPAIVFQPAFPEVTSEWDRHHVRPVVASIEQAEAWRSWEPILSVDTGQQRFACPPQDVDAALRAGKCREAMTHASTPEQVRRFRELVGGRGLRLHAAGSALLEEPTAWFDAVRPGLALYRGAARVSARLVEVRDSTGPAGYTGFVTPRHGVILCGYSNGLRAGPCLMNGRRSRVLEVGMQTAFVECEPPDRAGDEVVLLGGGLSEDDVAAAWGTPPHTALVQLAGAGERRYLSPARRRSPVQGARETGGPAESNSQ